MYTYIYNSAFSSIAIFAFKCTTLHFHIQHLMKFRIFPFQEADIPLFLGADILAPSAVTPNNYSRIHTRYAKDKLATKVSLKGLY